MSSYDPDYMKRYYAKNKERMQRMCKEWKKKHPEKQREYALKYYYTHDVLGKLKEKGKNWYSSRDAKRKRLIAKRGNKCAKCGFNEFPQILEVHHLEKRNGKVYSQDYTRENFDRSKVIVLCPNCHRIEHIGDWGKHEA